MDALRLFFSRFVFSTCVLSAFAGLVLLSSCQMPYLVSSAYNQMSLLARRVPIEEALKDPKLNTEEREKLELSQKVRQFCAEDLGLSSTKNYSSFVKLDRPYVTYVVNASPKWELKNYEWSFPFVGKMPYKGYFNENAAKEEAEDMKKKDFDVYVRGVSAYSTLGWFRDPLLSSMLRYQDYDLVDTLIHETIHANLYIKNNANFNERLAVFLGGKGMQLFYEKLEGKNSQTLQKAHQDQIENLEFSRFISAEIKSLKQYYHDLKPEERNEELRQKRLDQIKENFKLNYQSNSSQAKFNLAGYKDFPNRPLNNARLLIFGTYMENLDDFEKLYQKHDCNFKKFFDAMKTLEKVADPEKALAQMASEKPTRTESNTSGQ